MTMQTLTLNEIKHQTVEDILRFAANSNQILRITFPEGIEVDIQPQPVLSPLPILKGSIPEGWKGAIYEHAE